MDAGAVAETWTPERTASVRGVPFDSVRGALGRQLESGERPAALNEASWRRVRALHGAYEHAPLWHRGDDFDRRAEMLVAALATSHEDGLRREAYPLAELTAALRDLDDGARPTADAIARAELLLTGAFVAYAEDMLMGQIDPRQVAKEWRIVARVADVDSTIARTLRSEPFDRALADLRPSDDGYAALRRELERYRAIVARGGWDTVPEGDALAPGDTATADRLRSLVARLRVEDYLSRDARITTVPAPQADDGSPRTDRAIYDAALAGAVARFQARHNIVVDSVLGAATVRSLNRSADYRLQQIVANLERHRWLPNDLGATYIVVNVPAFHLEAFRDGRRALDMRVVVGAEYNDRATPAFSDSMSYVEFAPYWNVPKEIALEEILPKAQADPAYMGRNGYEIVRGWGDEAPVVGQQAPDASAIASGELRIRQRPGPANALGRVKFMFPNEFAIYLHDTPERELFEKDVRAFSHGCIRVERPVDVARFVLGWDEARVRAAMQGGRSQVGLPAKIPVYIVYFTTYVHDGQLHFGNDLYDRDESLVNAVGGGATGERETDRLVAALVEAIRD